ncbi:hypothetical protein B0H14DRAFT_3148910 [Mycena olivaceomarginata]|nr:hypothetical protein B0H14DRAFT_3148910 [Mycena olivaceomarginata]
MRGYREAEGETAQNRRNEVDALAARRCEREAAAMVAAAARQRPIVFVEEGDEQEAGKAAQEARRAAPEACRNERQQVEEGDGQEAGRRQEAAPQSTPMAMLLKTCTQFWSSGVYLRRLPEAKEQTK